MDDTPGENGAVSAGKRTLVSRRRLLAAGAALGIAGGVGGLVGAQEEAADIELEGEMGGWIGVTPDGIDGETNPALDLEAEVEYTVMWTNADGMPHNFVIENGDGTVLVETETITEGSQTVSLTATEEMAEYYCGVHPETMRGELAVTAGDDEMDVQNETGEETDSDSDSDSDEAEADDPDTSEANDTDTDEGTMDDYGTDAESEPDDGDEAEETDGNETVGNETDNETTEEDADPAVDLPRTYHACLSGDAHGIETDMAGTATFEVHDHENGNGPEAHYTLTVEDSCNVTQAHIHLGSTDEDGPVVAWLYPETGMEPEPVDGGFSGTLAEGTIVADDLVGEWEGAAVADVLATFEEGQAYVNVHTEAHPGGEIRGQIQPVDE